MPPNGPNLVRLPRTPAASGFDRLRPPIRELFFPSFSYPLLYSVRGAELSIIIVAVGCISEAAVLLLAGHSGDESIRPFTAGVFIILTQRDSSSVTSYIHALVPSTATGSTLCDDPTSKPPTCNRALPAFNRTIVLFYLIRLASLAFACAKAKPERTQPYQTPRKHPLRIPYLRAPIAAVFFAIPSSSACPSIPAG